jgi:pimeloyl-ACP methyl ester carboxylesterase
MGTQLYKEGHPVWALSGRGLWEGIRTLGRNIKDLALPAGIGDEHPGDGVEPCGLMPGLHGLPGLGPNIGGYGHLSVWLRKEMGLVRTSASEAGNLLEFGYDWRLSNRYNACRLKKVAERELDRWIAAGHPQARLVLYCHSMGGLVARYYLEVLQGAERARALITVGTPHAGSPKALANLVNDTTLGLGPLKVPVTKLTRTFPSAYQLLPIYKCIDEGGVRHRLLDRMPSRLDRLMAEDAAAFHDEVGKAAGKNGSTRYGFRLVVGTRQPTPTTAKLVGERVELLPTIDGEDRLGDGTVPRLASRPAEMDPEDLHQISASQRHGWLHDGEGVLDDLQGILTAERVRYLGPPSPQRQPGIELPAVLSPEEPLVVRAKAAPDLLLFVTLCDEEGVPGGAPQPFDNLGEGSYTADLGRQPEGVCTVRVTGPPAAPIEPVTEAVLVAVEEEG